MIRFKLWLYFIGWQIKNRKWKWSCSKQRAFKRAVEKRYEELVKEAKSSDS